MTDISNLHETHNGEKSGVLALELISLRKVNLAVGLLMAVLKTAILITASVGLYLSLATNISLSIGPSLLCLCMLVPLWTIGKKDTYCRLARLWGKHSAASVAQEGIRLNGVVRWAWNEILFCNPSRGSYLIELMLIDRTWCNLVCVAGLVPPPEFESIKNSIINGLQQNKPDALIPD